MKFRCPCCKYQISPSDDNFEQDSRSSSADSDGSDRLISIAVGTEDSSLQNGVLDDIPEVIVENGRDTASDKTSAAESETSGL